jgi:outer membrane biosynthesis protein TonB
MLMQQQTEHRKALWAMLAAVVLHLLVAFSLAAFGASFTTPLEVEAKPVELTIVDAPLVTPPPFVPKNAPFVDVDASRTSSVAPKEKTFEANANSIAASESIASGANSLPGQEGKDRPFMNLETHESSLGSSGATPQPTPEPSQKSLALLKPSPPPEISPEAQEQENSSPVATPTPTPTPTPVAPLSQYRDFQQKTMIRGSISNRGRASVNAVGTPLGQYKKLLEDAIGSRWYYYMNNKGDLQSIGTTVLRFDIEADGHIENLRVTENTTTEVCAGLAIRSVQEAKFPPIPEELIPTLPNGHFTMEEMSFTIFPNR